MTGRTVGDIAVKVGADVGPLQKGLKRGAKDLDNFGDRASAMAGRVAKAGLAITAGLAGAAAAGYGLAKSAASAGAEIERLSTLAGVAPERFQRMAFAAKTVGIEQDKLADILKDVQDRIGDFLQTGGGPMKDFFENIAPQVGVTAEQFKKLNAADALQLYVTSLQRAGLTQNEMAFYMEAMAGDLTNLLPLLQDGGAEMKRLGDEAAAAGAVLSNDAVKGSQDLLAEFDRLEAGIRNKLIEAILDNKEEIKALADDITTVWIPALIEVAGAITKVVTAITTAIETYQIWRDLIRDGEAPGFSGNPLGEGTLGNIGDGGPIVKDPLSGGGGGTLSPGGAMDLYGIGGSDSIQGGDGSDMLLPFVSSQGELETARETMADHFAALNEIIAEGIDAKLATLSEGYAREKELGQEAVDADLEQERMRRAARLQSVAGMFGDLSSLMASENEKLFKIGKAAAIAEATVNGLNAAVKAWDGGLAVSGGNLGVAATYAAASLAKTGMLISQISSQSIGGGSSGGGGGGASAVSGGAGAAGFVNVRVTDIMDQISPDTGVRFGSVGELLKALQDEAGDRGLRFI